MSMLSEGLTLLLWPTTIAAHIPRDYQSLHPITGQTIFLSIGNNKDPNKLSLVIIAEFLMIVLLSGKWLSEAAGARPLDQASPELSTEMKHCFLGNVRLLWNALAPLPLLETVEHYWLVCTNCLTWMWRYRHRVGIQRCWLSSFLEICMFLRAASHGEC